MKRILLTACALLLMTTAITGQILERDARNVPASPLTWQSYTVKGEEFSVALPTVPAMTSSATLYPRLQKFRVERHLQTSLDGVVYSIDVFENIQPGQSLEDFIAEQNVNSDYDLATGRDLIAGAIRGKEYLSRDKSRPATVQFFTTERRLYRFTATGSDAANAPVKQFFSSIKFGKPKKATEVVDGPGMPLVLDTGERIYKGSEVTTKVRLISKPEPGFTEEALSRRTSGRVILWAIFSKTGEVTGIQVVAGLPNGLTELCVNAARRIKFVPATKDGQPVSMWMTLEYNFMS